MFYKVLKITFGLFTVFNISFALEIFLSLAIFLFVYLQKNSEDFSSQTKLSAPSSKSDFRIKTTYALILMFVANILLLNILYQKEYKDYVVKSKNESVEE